MNERIKELAEQATTKISFRLDPTTYKHIDDPEGEFERVEFDKQKFAELIMQDMHKKVIASILITDVVAEEKGLIPTAEDYILAINKDFGVEE